MAWERRALRHWPAVALLLAFFVGLGFAGVGGGVLATTLAVLLVGPAFLIQKRIQRRRGLTPSGRGLDVEADAFFERMARAEVNGMRRHPLLGWLMLVAEVGGLAAVWLLLGQGWALSVIVATALLTCAAYARRRF